MRALVIGLSLGLLVLAQAPTATAQALEFDAADGLAEALVEADQATDIAAARQAGASVDIFTTRVDLNGDGDEEIVAQLSTSFLCPGAGGCPLLIYRAEGGRFARVGHAMGDGVDVMATQTGGWRDLKLIDQRGAMIWRWNGKGYVTGR